MDNKPLSIFATKDPEYGNVNNSINYNLGKPGLFFSGEEKNSNEKNIQTMNNLKQLLFKIDGKITNPSNPNLNLNSNIKNSVSMNMNPNSSGMLN